jgi:hypothetical protein
MNYYTLENFPLFEIEFFKALFDLGILLGSVPTIRTRKKKA